MARGTEQGLRHVLPHQHMGQQASSRIALRQGPLAEVNFSLSRALTLSLRVSLLDPPFSLPRTNIHFSSSVLEQTNAEDAGPRLDHDSLGGASARIRQRVSRRLCGTEQPDQCGAAQKARILHAVKQIRKGRATGWSKRGSRSP